MTPSRCISCGSTRGGATISTLQVACVYYVGVQLLLPGQDAGIDFARVYELAKGMVGG